MGKESKMKIGDLVTRKDPRSIYGIIVAKYSMRHPAITQRMWIVEWTHGARRAVMEQMLKVVSCK
jgi:hypothetical protein